MRVDSKTNRRALSESYIHRDTFSTGLPIFLIVESSSICNLDCIMCPYGTITRQKELMSMSLYERLIEQASESVEFLWLHMFNEPLLNKNIYKMIDMAEEAGIRTGLSTNATPLTEKTAEAVLNSRLSLMMVSIDGATKETYEYIRAGASFEQVEKNLATFATAKLNSSNDHLKASLSIIDMNANQDELNTVLGKWQGVGYDNIYVKPFHNWAGQDADILQRVSAAVIGEAPEGTACYEPWVGFAVLADGTVVPCCNDYDARQILGDLRNQTIKEVWNGSAMRKLRKMFANSEDREGTICHKCPTPCAAAGDVRGGHGPFDPKNTLMDIYLQPGSR